MIGTFRRRLALPTRVATWSLTRLQQRVGEHRRTTRPDTRANYWLLLAESHLTRQLFAGMLRKRGFHDATVAGRMQSSAGKFR